MDGDVKEPTRVNTHGRWEKYPEELEDGKSYRISIKGDCLVALSSEKPTLGIKVKELEFTKQSNVDLWIFTGK